MKWFVRLFDFYLDASIHVAFAVFALVHVTYMIIGIEANHHLPYYLFFGTIVCYNFVKYGVEAEKYFLVANRYHRQIQIVSFIALLLALYHAHFLNWETWVAIGIISLLIGLYALPVLPQAKNLRSLGLVKIVLVGLVWSLSTVLLPVIEAKAFITWDVWVEMAQRFLMVLVLMIPFEIRDLKYDAPALRTLPQRIGSMNAKSLGAIMAVVLFFLTLLKDEVSVLELIAKGILCLGLELSLFLTKRDQSKYYALFWVESIPIAWWGVLWCLGFYL